MENVRLRVLVYRALAAFGVLGGVIVLTLSARGPSSFPERQSLTELTGTVAWVRPYRYGLQFGFEGDARTYVYAQKSGELPAVGAALNDSRQQPITVWITQPSSPNASLPHQVLEIRTRTKALRTLDEVRGSWAEDYQYGYLAGLMVLLAAGYLEYRSQKLGSS